MDHLFRIPAADGAPHHPNELTLCICHNQQLDRGGDINIDDSDCAGYLARRGWDKVALLNGQWRAAHPDNQDLSSQQCFLRCLGALQAWFTFGLLQSCVFLEHLDPHGEQVHILAQVDRSTVVTGLLPSTLRDVLLTSAATGHEADTVFVFDTSKLVFFLECFNGLMNNDALTDPDHIEYKQMLPDSTLHAMNELQGAHMRLTTTAFRRSIDVQLETDSGEEVTKAALGWLFGMPTLLSPTISLFLSSGYGMKATYHPFDPKLLVDLITRPLQNSNEWCPAVLSMLETRVKLFILVWMWARGINPTALGADHSRCDNSTCIAYNVTDEDALERRHECTQQSRHECYLIRPDLDQIAATLESGGTPLVRYVEGRLEVASFTKENPLPYVAFSHVWQQGRGSCSEDGLHACQLDFLQRTARKAYAMEKEEFRHDQTGDIFFWMDSLCVPRNPDLRRRAIVSMFAVYSNAQAVVVVDEALRALAADANEREVLLLQILASPWMSRVWTWQEGSVAQKLWILFSENRLLCLAPTWIDGMSEEDQLYLQTSCPTYHYLKREMALNVFPTQSQFRVTQVMRELQFRQTSKPRDELIAVAALVGVSVADLQQYADMGERMAYFLQRASSGQLSSQIIFIRGDKVRDVPFFRWAPISLSGREQPGLSSAIVDARCTSEGLQASYLSIVLSSDIELRRGVTLFINHERASGQEYEVSLVHQHGETFPGCRILLFNLGLGSSLAIGSPEDAIAAKLIGTLPDGRLKVEYLTAVHVVRSLTPPLVESEIMGSLSRVDVLLQ